MAGGLTGQAARVARQGDPRGAAQHLRRLLGEKVAALGSAEDLDKAAAEDLAKIGAALGRLEGAGYDLKAAAVEVLGRLADFAAGREADAPRRAWLADLMDAFFDALDAGE